MCKWSIREGATLGYGQALPDNISLGWKWLPVTNALQPGASLTQEKSFLTLPPGGDLYGGVPSGEGCRRKLQPAGLEHHAGHHRQRVPLQLEVVDGLQPEMVARERTLRKIVDNYCGAIGRTTKQWSFVWGLWRQKNLEMPSLMTCYESGSWVTAIWLLSFKIYETIQ